MNLIRFSTVDQLPPSKAFTPGLAPAPAVFLYILILPLNVFQIYILGAFFTPLLLLFNRLFDINPIFSSLGHFGHLKGF